MPMQRRDFLTRMMTGVSVLGATQLNAQWITAPPYIERAGAPHVGKVLAAIQPHADDIALLCAGTVAKLLNEGYTGYMIRATNDDMGDEVGDPGTPGENVYRNEREVDEQTRVLGLKKHFSLQYPNHRMSDVSRNELICRLIFLFRFLKVDTVFCYDPWGHDEENPDHYVLGHCVEAASWMAGRIHDYPEQIAAGFEAQTVKDKYYYARRPEITRVVDISSTVEKKIDANLANMAKGPGGHHGSRLRAQLAKEGKKLPLLGDDDVTADRNYIREFVLEPSRVLGQKYGLQYAEAFHYLGPMANAIETPTRMDEYIRKNAVPLR